MLRFLVLLSGISRIVVVFAFLAAPSAAETADPDSLSAYWKYNPYAPSKATLVDSTDVFSSPRPNYLLAMPSLVWTAMTHPLGRFITYAEHTRLPVRYREFFTNKAGTFGLFPQMQLGGETGTGGGARLFLNNGDTRRQRLEAFYVYSGARGNTGQGRYLNRVAPGLQLSLDGLYLQTRNRSSTINSAVRDDPTRTFEIQHIDAIASLMWHSDHGPLAPFKRSVQIEAWSGYGRRDLRVHLGTAAPLVHPGHTPIGTQFHGATEDISLVRAGGRFTLDDRDYRSPTSDLDLPIEYEIPGRILVEAGGLYHSYRDLGYPERGGVVSAEAEYVKGSDGYEYYRIAARVSRYITLFLPNRVLALNARVEKLRGLGGSSIPYSELAMLGGGDSARGYRRGYFRGQGGLILSAEYRYPIWDYWNIYAFWDESQIFDHFDSIGRAASAARLVAVLRSGRRSACWARFR